MGLSRFTVGTETIQDEANDYVHRCKAIEEQFPKPPSYLEKY